ncbi:hypothetical protein [Undibacterium sp. Ren11W]|uniref:hypothetical protein n=1 Tax=Undibacterium sp. Ren11W TaxID=3413045 RepID=UPI003BF14FAF
MFTFYWEDYSWLMALFCFISIFLLWLRREPMPREKKRPAADWERSIIMPKAPDAILNGSGPLSREPSLSLQHSSRLQVRSSTRNASAPAGAEFTDDELFDFAPASIGGGIVVEQTSTLQQAQFWADLGMPGETIAILSPIIADDSNPGSWLLLMDAYVRCGKQAEYEDISVKFSAQFNGQVPSWQQRLLGHTQKGLNDYPELRKRVSLRLAQSGGTAWLAQLLRDDRDGKRLGFEYAVYCDLARLYETLKANV